MSHIPGLHRQAFGMWLVSIFLLTLAFLFHIAHTGSDDTSVTALLSLLSIFPFPIITYVVERDVLVRSALRVLAHWCTIAFQRTLVLCSSLKHVSDSLVNLHHAPFARTWTAILAIPKAIDIAIESFARITSSTCSIKSELELLEEGFLLPDESLFPQQSQWLYRPSSFPPVRPQDIRTATSSTPSPSLAACPPAINTFRLDSDGTWTSSLDDNTKGSNATPLEPATSFGPFSNDVVVHRNVDPTETTLGSTLISRASRSNQLGVALTAPINGTAKSNASSVRKSSVPFPSLSTLPGDTGPTGQTESDVFAEIAPLRKRSRKIALQNLKFVNVDILRGPVLAATAPRRAGTILLPLPPRIVIHEISTASFSSSGSQKYTASTSSSPHSISTSTFQTTATTPCSSQIDLQSDVEPEVPGAPTATAITTADVELLQSDDAQNLGEVATSPFDEDVRLRDAQTGSGARMKIPEFETAETVTQNDYDWHWAKTTGKQPEREEEDDVDEEDDEDEDEEDDEEDGEDEQGFSTRLMRKTMAKSKRAAPAGVARLFDGASTSTVVKGPLSQAKWDMLEQFEAVPSSPKKVIRSPSPAPTGVEAEIAVPYWLSAPLPPLPEAAPIKTKRVSRLRKFIKRIFPLNPFKNRG